MSFGFKFIVYLVLFVVFIIIASIFGGFTAFGYNVQFYLDNLFKLSEVFNPIAMWAIFGFIIGGAAGIIIAVKKLQLNRMIAVYSIGGLIIFFILVSFISSPMHYETYNKVPELNKVESNIIMGTINGESVNIRSGPSKNASKIASLKKGQIVEIVSHDGEWILIKFDTRSGFVHQKYVDKN